MIQAKLIFVFLNLALVRLVVAELQDGVQVAEIKSDHPSVGSIAALDQINSLEHAQTVETPVKQEKVTKDELKIPSKSSPTANNRRRSRSKPTSARNHSTGPTVASLLVGLLGQLERVDLRRVLVDLTTSSLRADAVEQRSYGDNLRTQGGAANKSQASIPIEAANSNQQRNGKVNVSALSAESGNLFSITKQLVKLARNQVIGNEFGQYFSGAPSSSWSAPLMMPSMLSAASHAFHDSLDLAGGHHTGATLKSEWFWWVAPAVIVIGTGVIVVPLIAAWLVSQAMSQNTFTVSAGRRRRRRSVLANELADSPRHQLDLFKVLDIHRLLDDAPELLAEQLGRFHEALEHVGSQFLSPKNGGHKHF